MNALVVDDGQLVVAGALAGHQLAEAFAQVVQRVHHRFATEVVGAFLLCPFMKDPSSAFGRFCVMLDRELDIDAAAAQVVAAGVSVVHVVYPLVEMSSTPFERYGNQLHDRLAIELDGALVHATFHPDMEGGTETPARTVGLLRRAPDPFVQFVPEGLHKGGTEYMDPATFDLAKVTEQAAAPDGRSKLDAAQLADIAERQRDIKKDRASSYARFLDALR